MYLTYEEYTAWGGALEESAFTLAEIKARARLDALTQGRIANMETIPDVVKAAMMEIIQVDTIYGASAQAASPVYASFTTDGYSETYGSAESRTATVEKQLAATLTTLLDSVLDDDGVPLLYAGVPTSGAWYYEAD